MVPRKPKSTWPPASDDTPVFWSGSAGGVFCCPALAVAASSRSASNVTEGIVRMIMARQRSSVLPAGLFDPWICEWQLTQLRPMSRLLFAESALPS